MRYSTALSLLVTKQVKKVSNENWNGKGMHVAVQWPDAGSANTAPYLYIVDAQGKRVPWLASQQDSFSEGWYNVE